MIDTETPNRQSDLTLTDVVITRALRVQAIYRLTIFSVMLHTILAIAYGGYLYSSYQSTAGLIWAGYFVLLGLVRVIVWTSYNRFGARAENQSMWILLATAMMILTGAGWGSSALLFMGIAPPATIVYTTLIVASLAVAGIILLAPLSMTMFAFSLTALIPLVWQFLLGEATDYWFAGVLVILIYIGSLFGSLRAKKGMMQSMRLLVENKRLAEAAEDSRGSLTAANDELMRQRDQQRSIEEDLRQAKIEADSAVMAKSEFLATMSHEIRTPLNGILPILDILRSTDLDPTQLDYLQTAFQSSKHLLSIIDDILDYSKIEAGKLELEDVGLNLKELMDSVSRLMAGSASKKGVELRTRIEPGVRLAARGDPVRLRQVLTNLVSNAIKFTDSGFVDISIKKHAETRTHNELLFRIRDTGIGMDAATASKLFKPFSQANASTTRTYGGSGLGLAICKRLVNLMQGKIGVKSEPDRGSVFWFLIKLKKSTGDLVNQRKEVHDSRVIITCGDDALKQRLSVFIEGWGTEAQSIGSLRELIAKLEKISKLGSSWNFDVLVIDIGSLGEQAYELIRQIKQNTRLSDACILVLNQEGSLPASIAPGQRVSALPRDVSQGTLHEAIDELLNAGLKQNLEKVTGTQTAVSHLPQEGQMPIRTTTPKVLLVEDNPVNLHVAQKLMQILDCEFKIAKNGQEGLNLMKAESFNLVLMDCMMPMMDGYTATREWRKHEASRGSERLPIVAMTANAMAGDRQKCLQAGMDDYMAKPLNKLVVSEMISRWSTQTKLNGQTDDAKPEMALKSIDRNKSANQNATAARTRPAAPADSLIDHDILRDLTDIMGDESKVLIDVYLEDTPKILDQIEHAIRANQISDMIMPAHSLKSTSANLGALGLSDIARQMEQDARKSSASNYQSQLDAARQQFERIRSELLSLEF